MVNIKQIFHLICLAIFRLLQHQYCTELSELFNGVNNHLCKFSNYDTLRTTLA